MARNDKYLICNQLTQHESFWLNQKNADVGS